MIDARVINLLKEGKEGTISGDSPNSKSNV